MNKRKSRFLTFLFSLLPGAGHMYLGFMKNGVSFMAIFFFLIFVASWLNISPLIYAIPVIWFYSFFDCLNKSSMSDEEFAIYKDDYLFSIDALLKMDNSIIKKKGALIGAIILFFGCYLLFNNITDFIMPFFPDEFVQYIRNITYYIPKILVSVVIIFIGLHLISGKKKESKNND